MVMMENHMHDVLLRNGTIIDGTGNASFKADLAIKGDHIAEIRENIRADRALNVIDASGLVVAPGFIDMHSHSDLTLFASGGAESALCQGVTTEVIGNCGFSSYPVHPERLKMLENYLVGIGYDRSYQMPWRDFEGYASHLETKGISVNAASLVGHGSIRIAVMGFDSREATVQEREEMANLLQIALDQGAFGMSSGLVYPPGINSPSCELEELCAITARAGGLYATHLRGDSLRAGPSLLESLDEALHAARVTGVSLQVSHVAAKFPNTGVADRVVERMEKASDEGIRVGCDIHPYMAAMTFLVSLMPPWFFEGGADEAMRRLSNPAQRMRLRRALEATFGHLGWDEFWSRNQPIFPDPSSPFNGKRFDEIARAAGKDASEVLLDILLNESADIFKIPVLMWIYSPDDTLKTFLWHRTMIGADGVSTSPHQTIELMSSHPRSWGSFPAALKRFVWEGGHVTLEEALRRMTSLPAAMIGLRDRGALAEGMKADIAIFDPERFTDKGTYESARQCSEGMVWVFVNGAPAIEKGRPTGKRMGKVLRRA
jgi:N-acyl-D-amino-acid deacylase